MEVQRLPRSTESFQHDEKRKCKKPLICESLTKKNKTKRAPQGQKILPKEKHWRLSHMQTRQKICNKAVLMNHLEKCHSESPNNPIPNLTVLTQSKLSWTHNNRDLLHVERWLFFKEARESTTIESTDPNERVDQLLKLFHGCSVMPPGKKETANDIVNGTMDTFKHLVLKTNTSLWAANAEDIKHVLFWWTEDSNFQNQFSLGLRTVSCTFLGSLTDENEKKWFNFKVKITQIWMTSNNITMRHKLQSKWGDWSSIDEWIKGVKIWICVAPNMGHVFNGNTLRLINKCAASLGGCWQIFHWPNDNKEVSQQVSERVCWTSAHGFWRPKTESSVMWNGCTI